MQYSVITKDNFFRWVGTSVRDTTNVFYATPLDGRLIEMCD